MNEKRVEELQSSFMAFNSISELVLIVKSKNSEEEAVEAARRELKKRENIGLSELDPRIDEKEIPPYVLILSIILVILLFVGFITGVCRGILAGIIT